MANNVFLQRFPDKDGTETTNLIYFDAAIRHQIGIRNLTTTQVNDLVTILEEADAELREELAILLSPFAGRPLNISSRRYRDLIATVRSMRDEAMDQIGERLVDDMMELADREATFEYGMILAALPIIIPVEKHALSKLERLRQLPFSTSPLGMRTLDQWMGNLKQVDQVRIIDAIQQGLALGESVDEIVRRIGGTRRAGFTDGVLAQTRMNLDAIVRTAVNAYSQAGRELVWDENPGLVPYLIWTSVLDSRTSDICRARDGKVAILGDHPTPRGVSLLEPQTARPPAHVRCRSIMVGAFSMEGVVQRMGDRPWSRNRLTGEQTKLDFVRRARERYGKDWPELSERQQRSLIDAAKMDWARRHIGTVPGSVNYEEWLRRQPHEFQDEVLGKTKGELFRKGGVTLDEFVTTRGKAVTLSQLAKSDPAAFMKAGLDPTSFE